MDKRGLFEKSEEVKKGQIKLSFGMIFSVILIVIFLVFAFYAISTFLGIQRTAEVGVFVDDFRSDVDTMWKSQGGSQEREYNLPSRIEMVCFIDSDADKGTGSDDGLFEDLKFRALDEDNLVFYPIGSAETESVEIRNIDIGETTNQENPFCIENNGGTLELVLIKEFGEAEVIIKRQE
ncbi:MAG: hypothetical protein WDZ69_01130 [Candidatus Pacearchaeota archaeon]